MEFTALEMITYWKGVYEDEYEAEAETQDSLMSLALDDLMDGLDSPYQLF